MRLAYCQFQLSLRLAAAWPWPWLPGRLQDQWLSALWVAELLGWQNLLGGRTPVPEGRLQCKMREHSVQHVKMPRKLNL